MEAVNAPQVPNETNCVDMADAQAKHGDMLELLFNMQHCLQTGVMHYDLESMSEKERGEYVRDYTLYCIDEFSEMLHEIPFFKLWKKYSNNPTDNLIKWQKARMEFVDALHFFLNIALGLGFTAEELFQMYVTKYQENIARQQYTTEYKPAADAT